MIQILGLRTFAGEDNTLITYDKEFYPGIEVETVKDLFENYERILKEIPKREHWNLFYTIANCTDKKRDFKSISTIAFDIDKIVHQHEESYIVVVCEALNVNKNDIGIVRSGNGMHFLIGLETPVCDKAFFKNNKPHYKAICSKIKNAMDAAGLPGEVDTVVFEPARILRLPGTVNKKPNKPDKRCELVQKIGNAPQFNMAALSGLPEVTSKDQVHKTVMKNFPKTDPRAVMNQCDFLTYCMENAGKMDEPSWYAALSIVARLDGQGSSGWERSHDMSKNHPGYTRDGTDAKITQALEASGPRTCESIQTLWGKCVKCKHWGKISSPILIQGKDYIRTEGTGFHHVLVQKNGEVRYKPAYEDLIKFFKRNHSYRGLGYSGGVMVWNGTHYEEWNDKRLKGYAREKFTPKGDSKHYAEFESRVRVDNLVPMEWWNDTPERKINFTNGYLDIDTMKFSEHTKEIGFRTCLPYEYNKEAKAPVFEKALSLWTGGDKDVQKVLLEYMGYCLSNDSCWTQKALMLTGEGSNGKSTFVETLKRLVGKGNYSSLSFERIDEPKHAKGVEGKLMNVMEEASVRSFKENGTFKNFVAGGTLSGHILHISVYEFENKAKLVMTCNKLPKTNDQTKGFYRRLLIVPFEQTILDNTPGYDPHLIDKLKEELPGVMNLALWGYKKLVQKKGFTRSEVIEAAQKEYRMNQDSVLSWAEENLEVTQNLEDGYTTLDDLYEAYKGYCVMNGFKYETNNDFYNELRIKNKEIWGDSSYKERKKIKRIKIEGNSKPFKGLRGVRLV